MPRPCRPRRAGLAAQDQPELGSGAVHLHVHLDGQVRRRLWRAHRHPRRRRRADQPACRTGTAPKVIVFGLLAGALFTGVIGTLGAEFVWDIAHTQQVSADLEMPMWIVYSAIPCGSYLMCFRFLQVTWSFLRTGDTAASRHRQGRGAGRGGGRSSSGGSEPRSQTVSAYLIFGLLIALMLTGHADLDRARPHGLDLPVHHDRRAACTRWR